VDIRHDGGKSKGYTEKVKLKCYNKLNALNDLGKHLGIFEDDLGKGDTNVQVNVVYVKGE